MSEAGTPSLAKGVNRNRIQADAVPLGWLSIEMALYGALGLLALLVRLAGLGRWPLLAEELNTALAAWRALQGAEVGHDYVPLLFNVQWLLFALQSGAFAARLLPALAGTLLVFLPWAIRDFLGRIGALTVAAFLALSPSWVYAGRTADGAVLAVALLAVAFLFDMRYFVGGKRRDAGIAVAALAASLTAGPAVYTPLVASLLLGGLWLWRWATPDQQALLGERWREAQIRDLVWLFAVVFLGLTTALWLNPGGLGAAVNMAWTWVSGLVPAADGLPWYHVLRVLAIYEPLLLALAVVGGIWGLPGRRPAAMLLSIWLAYALFLSIPLGHREPVWLLGVILPLTILAGLGVQALYDGYLLHITRADLIAWALALSLVGFSYLELTLFLRTGQSLLLVYAGFGLGLLILGLIGYGIWVNRASGWRAALLLVGSLLLVVTLRGTTALTFDRARDPWEPMLYRPASLSQDAFASLISGVSLRMAGDPRLVDILYEQNLSPWMAWLLRDYPNAHETLHADAASGATVLVTTERPEEGWPAGYVGQAFALWEVPAEDARTGAQRWQWLFYRPPVPPADRALFWVWVRMPDHE